jgi:protoheme IX farnesyltransferase
MHETLPTLAPTNRTVVALSIGIGMLAAFASFWETSHAVFAQIAAVLALLAATWAWVYTAPLRWPSVILLLSSLPWLIWPDLAALRIIVLAGASMLVVHGLVPTVANQRLGAKSSQVRQRLLIMLLASAALFGIISLLGHHGDSVCQALPLCADASVNSQIQNSHRILTVPAVILLIIGSVQLWRMFSDAPTRVIASITVVSMLAQIGLGLLLSRGNPFVPLHDVLALMVIGLTTGLGVWVQRRPWPITNMHQTAPTITLEDGKPYTWQEKVKDYVSLTKPGVISLLILTTITSMYITPAGTPSLALVIWTTIGGWLMAAASHSYNCYLDRDIDVLMGRTGRRPIPSGRIPGWHAVVLGTILMLLASAILVIAVNWVAAALAFAGLIYYVLIYTMWLKRTTFNNIVIGGGAGAFPPLVGWAAATGSLTLPSLFLFAIIFYWTPPHFWALAIIRQKDYARAGVPMLPVVAGDDETKRQIVLYTLLMFVVTVMPTPLQMLGNAYLLMAVGLGGIFTYYAVQLYRQGTTASAWGLYRFSLLYLALLFGAMVIDRVYFA